MKDKVRFYTAHSLDTEYFIVGNPNTREKMFVFQKDRPTGKTRCGNPNGVFDDYKPTRDIPQWVRPMLLQRLKEK